MAYVVVLNTFQPINKVQSPNNYNCLFQNIQLNTLLPSEYEKYRVEAYLRSTSGATANANARSISVRVSIIPTNQIITQDMVPSTVVAMTTFRNLPVVSFETNQFGQAKTVIPRPTNVSSILVTLWDDATNAVVATSIGGNNMNWILHLYFYPIEKEVISTPAPTKSFFS